MNARLRELREWLYVTIFEHYTTAGRAFDVALIAAIVMSATVVMLDSVSRIQAAWGGWLSAAEWFFTLLFTVEYLLRIACARRPFRYLGSFFGVVDLLAILPSYASLFFPGYRFLVTIRILRILRVFRILKLAQYVGEADTLWLALKSSGRKITVFITTVLTVVVIVGSLMFLIEGAEAGFTSIPKSIYWAVVTMTTVGYGDIAPRTPLGQGPVDVFDGSDVARPPYPPGAGGRLHAHDRRLRHHSRADRHRHR